MAGPYSIEVCAGAGGQALGLEQAGFHHLDLVEIDQWACQTLRANRPLWKVTEADLTKFKVSKYKGIDLYAGGLPCPPFSVAGKQLGEDDERNLFNVAIDQIAQCRPKAVLIENVRGLLGPQFDYYREIISGRLGKAGFHVGWKLLNARDFGVPQQRPRLMLVGIQKSYADHFSWPETPSCRPPTVGNAVFDLMASRGWKGAKGWREKANGIAPTIVGGSKKHGGPDLGPTRAKRAWSALGVNGLGIADLPPDAQFPEHEMPKLTVEMVARIQGFPDSWRFAGRKTNAYRQVGNAFPPPVARAVALSILKAISERKMVRRSKIYPAIKAA